MILSGAVLPAQPTGARRQGVLQGHFIGGRPLLPSVSPAQPRGGPNFSGSVTPLPPGFNLLSIGGKPLPRAIQRKMEGAFGENLSSVRVHVAPVVSSLGALAFTIGSDLYFAPGQYQPETPAGQRLLGHELAHVVQQRRGQVRNPLASGIAIVHDPRLEAEADRMAQRALTLPAPAAPPYPPYAPKRVKVAQPSFEKYMARLHEAGQLSDKAQKRLREGQDAIRRTRKKLNTGAGNITQQVVASSGLSFVTTHHVKNTATGYAGIGGVHFLEAWAIAARRGSAGNCDEFAAVTYFYLLEMATGDNISVVGLPDVHHHFVMIGSTADPSGDETVIVDPWPAQGFAVLHKHWQYSKERLAVTLGPTRSNGQTPLKDARAKLNTTGHTRERFDGDLKYAFDAYGKGSEMRKKIGEVHKGGGYLWSNEHTLSKENLDWLNNHFEARRATVANPLALDTLEFEAIYGAPNH
jgi:hypothetical protein